MAESPWRRMLEVVRRQTDPDATGPIADERLLARFVANGDPSAFELLVWRHGSLVFGTCRRILGDAHAAEDAFQATFLALARKPRAVRSGAALAGWLHRVAVRVANRLRVSRTRQAAIERRAARAIEAPAANDTEYVTIVDDEIDRLPARLRSAVVLCYLDGRTTEQAAEILGCPRGTVLSRLSTARDRLRDRLTRRGLALPVAGISALMFAGESPASLIPAAVRAALTGASPLITGLVQGVFHAMLLTKVKIATAVVLGIGLAGAGVGWVVVPGAGPGVVQAVEARKEPPGASTAKANPTNPEDQEASRTLELILEARRTLSEKLEQLEKEQADFRMKSPFIMFRAGHAKERLDALEAKRREMLLKTAELSARLLHLSRVQLPDTNDGRAEYNANLALVKLQLRGIDIASLRKAVSNEGKPNSAVEFLRTYIEAIESELEELKTLKNGLDQMADNEVTTLRQMTEYEMQDERQRNKIKQTRELLDVVTRRLAELNPSRTAKEK